MKPKPRIGPDGRRIRPGPDKLKLFLQQNGPMVYPLGHSSHTPPAMPNETNGPVLYATDSFDVRKLAGCEATVLGAGAVGSYVIQSLAAAELTINTVDNKNVESKHTRGGRTIYDASQIGQTKVQAIKQKIQAFSPGTKINPYAYDVGNLPDGDLIGMFARSLLVVVAIDETIRHVLEHLGLSALNALHRRFTSPSHQG